MKKNILIVNACMNVFCFSIGMAAGSPAKLTKPLDIEKQVSEKEIRYEDRTGFVTFFGTQLGYFLLQESQKDFKKNKSGYLIEGDMLASWYPSRWVLDLGLGWQYSNLRGSDKETLPNGSVAAEFSNVTIETQSALGNLGVLFRLSEKFQLGVAAKALFAADVGYDSGRETSSLAVFAGPQIAYGVPEKIGDIRFFANGMFSLNLKSKLALNASIGMLFGVPWVKPDTIYRERNIVGITEKVTEVQSIKVIPKILLKSVTRFSFSENEIVFKPNRALLGQENQKFLIDLSAVLQESKIYWEELTIECFVPPAEAQAEAAVKLSSARAAAIKNALVSAGLDAGIIKSRAALANLNATAEKLDPATLPVNKKSNKTSNEKPYFEIVFGGVNNEAGLNDILSKFKIRFKKPETCRNEKECK